MKRSGVSLLLLALHARANTETFHLRLQHPLDHQRDHPGDWTRVADWQDTNTLTLHAHATNTQPETTTTSWEQPLLLPVHFSPGSPLFVKVCWTAIDPISIEQVALYDYEETHTKTHKVLLVVQYTADTYPSLRYPVQINVSIHKNFIPGVPNELYPTLLLILTLVAILAMFSNHMWYKLWLY